MFYPQDIELQLGEIHAPQPLPVSPQALDGVDPHTPKHLLDLVAPGPDEVYEPLLCDLRVQPLCTIGWGKRSS